MRKQDDYNKLVGRIDDTYYFCDYIFNDGDDFKGATGTELCPISQDMYDEMTSQERLEDRLRDSWAESAKDGQTEQSLSDYAADIFAIDGDEAIFDLSGYDNWNKIREAEPELTEKNYPIFDCVGGGRCFYADMVFDKIYDEELWEKIKAIETK